MIFINVDVTKKLSMYIFLLSLSLPSFPLPPPSTASVPECACLPVSGLHPCPQGDGQRPLCPCLHTPLQQGLPARHGHGAGGRGTGRPGLRGGAVDRRGAALSGREELLLPQGHRKWAAVDRRVQAQEDVGEATQVSALHLSLQLVCHQSCEAAIQSMRLLFEYYPLPPPIQILDLDCSSCTCSIWINHDHGCSDHHYL